MTSRSRALYMLRLAVWLLLFAAQPLPVLALDPTRAITQFGHRSWGAAEGLPQVSVVAMAQTPDGYLWLATQGGLVRFDGVRFEIHDRSSTPDLPSNLITALLVAQDGALWVGSSGGVSRIQDGRTTTYRAGDGLGVDSVFSLGQSRDGTIWVGTNGAGLRRFRGGGFEGVALAQGPSTGAITAIWEDRSGRLWVGTRGSGLYRLDPGGPARITIADGLSNDFIGAVLEDRNGRVWVATDDGLVRLDATGVARYTTAEGLPDKVVLSVLEDRDGGLWVGTHGGGLARLAGERFETYSTQQGLSDDVVGSLFEDAEGNLWAGTLGGGLNQLRDTWFRPYGQPEGLSGNFARAVYEDRDGRLWVGTFGGGVTAFENGRLRIYGAPQGLPSALVWAIHEDAGGALWVGTYGGGVAQLRNGRFETYSRAQGLGSDLVWAVHGDRGGDVWVGTNGGGLARIRRGRVTNFTTRDGLSSDAVMSLLESRDGVLWIGTAGGGISRLEGGRFAAITSRQGLFDDIIHRILEDGAGNLWMTSNRGVFRVAKKALEDVAAGRAQTVDSIAYGVAEGMRSAECNSGHPAGWRRRDGTLWFPTVRGVVSVSPGVAPRRGPVPAAVIEAAIVDGVPLDPKRPSDRPPGKRNIEFRYTAPSFRDPDRLAFEYRLEGIDQTWVAAGDRRTAFYTHVPPGRYRFAVRAIGHEGSSRGDVASIEIGLEPYFHETNRFFALLAFVAGLGASGLHRLRVRHLKRRELELTHRVEEALAKVKVLSGLLPMCAWCKNIRDDHGYWKEVGAYIQEHSGADLTHGICPDCIPMLGRDSKSRPAPP